MAEEIWVFGEHQDGEFHPVVPELLVEATEVASRIGGEVGVVVLASSEGVPELSLLKEYGAQAIYLARHHSLNEYDDEIYVQVLADAVRQYEPRLVLVGETSMGSQFARRLAVRLGASFVPHYDRIQVQDKCLVATRPMYGGKVGATVFALQQPLVATLNPGAIGIKKPSNPGVGRVQGLAVDPILKQKRVQVLKHLPADPDSMDLREADIVIGGGKGIGSEAGFTLLREMARALGACVGGTRRARDLDWISFEEQIGQTGKTISPRLYIAIGISGSKHHTVGVRDSNLIIAINTDRNAPIFTLADLGVLGDAQQVLPALIRRIRDLEKSYRSQNNKA